MGGGVVSEHTVRLDRLAEASVAQWNAILTSSSSGGHKWGGRRHEAGNALGAEKLAHILDLVKLETRN
jgi:hypothetical protein